ncbi:MAG: NgoFVII family restriction endonuclease [Firmicutes bacterium]|nr:NgoFVII family restriction endonuclease [Bacillota bacterium]
MIENFNAKKINYHMMDVEKYVKSLKLVGSLSRLFSDDAVPFIHYRATEMIYCKSFKANNLARADVSADAKLRNNGIGIKTFRANSHTQKIAEFNKQQQLYSGLDKLQRAKMVAELRNARLQLTLDVYEINELFYHCILRDEEGFYLCEEEMKFIDIDKIVLLPKKKESKATFFTDGIEQYKFDSTKSTLFKKFTFNECFKFVEVDILENPLDELENLQNGQIEEITFVESAIIPLYSRDLQQGKVVKPKSGLNIWNSGGRKRDFNEVYIPFNKYVKEKYENFFPLRETPFEVELPSGKILSMKICQDGGKAIMSNPNKALGKWLLRDVLRLEEGTILTYEMLLKVGVDAVEFLKIAPLKYKLNFKEIGAFEEYLDSLER